MGSPYLEHPCERTIDVRQSIYCRENIVHREQYVCADGIIAVLPMAHQGPG
jgi:hypothetical protein